MATQFQCMMFFIFKLAYVLLLAAVRCCHNVKSFKQLRETNLKYFFFLFLAPFLPLSLSLSPNLLFISTYIKYTFSCFVPLLVCASSKTFRTFCTSTILYTLCFLSNVIVVLLSRQLQYVCCSRLSLFC